MTKFQLGFLILIKTRIPFPCPRLGKSANLALTKVKGRDGQVKLKFSGLKAKSPTMFLGTLMHHMKSRLTLVMSLYIKRFNINRFIGGVPPSSLFYAALRLPFPAPKR